jgi:hypothetical protein
LFVYVDKSLFGFVQNSIVGRVWSKNRSCE